MGYIYDIHVHSSECSACSSASAREMVRAYHASGIYSGFVLTNHFYGVRDEAVDWEAHIMPFWNAYLEAKDEGDKLGFQVFFGIEYSYGGSQDMLFYGIDIDFLLANKDFKKISAVEAVRRVQDYGGFVSHAHPFRRRAYVPEHLVHIDMTLLDGIETYNAADREVDDEVAVKRCEELGLIPTGGSDRHHLKEFGKCPNGGMEFDRRIEDIHDLVKAMKNREGKVWHQGERVYF